MQRDARVTVKRPTRPNDRRVPRKRGREALCPSVRRVIVPQARRQQADAATRGDHAGRTKLKAGGSYLCCVEGAGGRGPGPGTAGPFRPDFCSGEGQMASAIAKLRDRLPHYRATLCTERGDRHRLCARLRSHRGNRSGGGGGRDGLHRRRPARAEGPLATLRPTPSLLIWHSGVKRGPNVAPTCEYRLCRGLRLVCARRRVRSPWAMGEHVASAMLARRFCPESRFPARVNGIKCQKRFLAVRTQWQQWQRLPATRLSQRLPPPHPSPFASSRRFAGAPGNEPPPPSLSQERDPSANVDRTWRIARAGSHLLRWRMQIAKCVARFMRRIPKKAAGSPPALARGYKSALVAAISFRSHT